ncbi:hypothetical protein MTO96_033033 [Rhipicephalus appendiculatus]
MAATLTDKQAEQDSVYLNKVQNIIVISTPVTTNAKAYATVRKIHTSFGAFEVSAYVAAPENTCKGVLINIDPSITEQQLNEAIVNSRNPTAIGVKRIKNTRVVIVLFEGSHVPRHVACGSAYMECSLYRRQVDICYACGQVGHRADVCHKSKEEKEKCHNCGMNIPSGTRGDAQLHTQVQTLRRSSHHGRAFVQKRYHVPYIVRKRRRDRRSRSRADQEEDAGAATMQGTPDAAPSQRSLSRGRSSSRERSCSREHSRSRERSRSRGRSRQRRGPGGSAGSRSRSRSRSKAKLTWADKVRGGSSSSNDNTSGARPQPRPSTPG